MSGESSSRGALLGLACGDALGRPVEFRTPGQIEREFGRLEEMVGGGTHGKPAGTITDDTELALRIAESLVDCGEFDGADVAARFVDWYDSGPFDIGLMTADALSEIRAGTPWTEAGQTVWERRPEGQNAGNGSVMRCAPHAIVFADDADCLVDVSVQSSRITHADPRCTYGCAVLNLTIAGLIRGRSDPLSVALDAVRTDAPDELLEELDPVATGDRPDDLQNSGYVVHSLQTALHDALTAESAEEAIVKAANRGGDADTIGAIAGAVAGARFGAEDLPERWLSEIPERDRLDSLAGDLDEM